MGQGEWMCLGMTVQAIIMGLAVVAAVNVATKRMERSQTGRDALKGEIHALRIEVLREMGQMRGRMEFLAGEHAGRQHDE